MQVALLLQESTCFLKTTTQDLSPSAFHLQTVPMPANEQLKLPMAERGMSHQKRGSSVDIETELMPRVQNRTPQAISR